MNHFRIPAAIITFLILVASQYLPAQAVLHPESLLIGHVTIGGTTGLANVKVTLTGEQNTYFTFTDAEGKYEFDVDTSIEHFSISLELNDNPRNGVSTLDMVRILKHLLGVEKLTNPLDLIAADANNSLSVSALDMIELRKIITGVTTSFPNNKSWRFVPEGYTFPDPLLPWSFPDTISIPNSNHITDLNFYGIKIGDVNHTIH